MSPDIPHRNVRILDNPLSPESMLATVEATHILCHQMSWFDQDIRKESDVDFYIILPRSLSHTSDDQ